MNNEKISNEMADRLIEDLKNEGRHFSIEKIKQVWKFAGRIEESALEKARKQYAELLDFLSKRGYPVITKLCEDAKDVYEQGIAELEARIKELEEVNK